MDTFTIGAELNGQLATGVPILLTSDSSWLSFKSDCTDNTTGASSISVSTTATITICADPTKIVGNAGYYVGLIRAEVPFSSSYTPVTVAVKLQHFPLGDFTVDPPNISLSSSQTSAKVKISKPPSVDDQGVTAAKSADLQVTAQLGQPSPEGNWLQFNLTNATVGAGAPGEIAIQVNPSNLTSQTPATYVHTVVITDQNNNVDGITVSYAVQAQAQTSQPVRSFAHIAPQPNFATQIVLTNTSGQAVTISLKFFHDDGSAFVVPVMAAAGTQMVDTVSDTIPANGTNYYELSGASSASANIWGSAQLTAPNAVAGVALFRNVPDSKNYFEAAVPLSAGSASFIVPFDLTTSSVTNQQFATGFAVANMDSSKPASVNCTARDSGGSLIPSASLNFTLQSNGHYASVLPAAFSGRRGALSCTSTATVSAVSLRFQGNEFTTLPAISLP